MKTCTKCGETKAMGEFGFCQGHPRSRCKPCSREADRNRYRANPAINDRSKARLRAVRAARGDEVRSAERTYWAGRRNQKSEIARRYYESHREAILLMVKVYQEAHPEQIRKNQCAAKAAARLRLDDWYVVETLRANLPRAGIPQDLIQMKREALILRRLATSLKQATNQQEKAA